MALTINTEYRNSAIREDLIGLDNPYGEVREETSNHIHVYEPAYCFVFEQALTFLKAGHKIARKGWNGKNMWLILVPGSEEPVEMRDNSPYARAGLRMAKIDSHIDMMTADGTMQPGWLASQPDILAEDWGVL